MIEEGFEYGNRRRREIQVFHVLMVMEHAAELRPPVDPPFQVKLHQQTLSEQANAVDIIIEFDLDYGPTSRLYDELDNYILNLPRS